MHIWWLAVICDIDCVNWLLLCWVFFCFFLFGPPCYIIFPYKELLIHRHRTRRSTKDFKYLEEAQLNILGLPSQLHYSINIYSEYQWCIGLTISVESTSVQNPHSSYDPANRKTSQLQDQRYIFRHSYWSYTKFWLNNAWCLKNVIIQNKFRMWYAQGRQSNHFSHANNPPQNIMGVCMDFSLHISMKFWI